MELEQLRQLEAVARTGTMSAAAEELRVSQSALSRSIKRLEAELGQPLFDRAGRRVQLNEAGRIALDHARQILRSERLMREELADHARQARALTVGTVAPAPLWRLTALLVERFPQTALTSQLMDERAVERAIIDGTIDLGISMRPLMLPTVRGCRLMTESISVSLPAGHPLAGASSLSAAELDGQTFLLFSQIGFWQEYVDTYFPRSKFIVQQDRTVFEQLTRTTELPYFVTDAPSFSGAAPAGGRPPRAVVPLRDTTAHATFYLLVREAARAEALAAFEWVRQQS